MSLAFRILPAECYASGIFILIVDSINRLKYTMKVSGAILVIDDDEDDHHILKTACEKLGVSETLKFFYDGHSLLKYLKSTTEQPYIILCDINMPRIDGIKLRHTIWHDEALRKKSIPFIFFSTAASPSQVKEAYDLTVQGFFLKGQTMDETERKLRLIFEYWGESRHPNSL